MKINKYPDGTSYVTTEHIGEESSIFKINTYEDLHHLEQFVDAYNNKYHQKPLITIPNLIDAQADKRFEDNQSSGLKIVLKRLNSIHANFKVFHPHNPEVVEALMDNVEIIDNSQFIDGVISKLSVDLRYKNKSDRMSGSMDKKNLYDVRNRLILMSSDAGGFKPLMKLCDKLRWRGETTSASKYRLYLDGKSKLMQIVDREDYGGKDILIIDDISVYGGTFKGLSKLLKERNCGNLYLAVSHMTMQELGEDPVTNYFDQVFTTNSKFDTYHAEDMGGRSLQPENLKVIKLF
jgi:ribose-phosphate pyrophosphokinase